MARKRKSPSSATAGVDEAAAAGTNTADEPSSQDHDEAMQTVPEMRPADALEGGAADAGQQPAGRGGRTHNGGAATPPRARVEASPPRRLLVILHGKRAQDKEVAAAIEAVRAAGHTVDVRVTFEAGDVEKIVWDALRRSSGTAGAAREMSHPNAAPPYETLVAAGGDGTLNEVVAAVVSGGAAGRQGADKCPSVALLPLGTR